MPLLVVALGIGVIGLFTGFIWGPVNAAVQALAAVGDGVVNLLPNAGTAGLDLPEGLVFGYTIMDSFLPIHEALQFAGVLAGIAVVAITFRVAVIVYHLIPKPGIGT